MFREWTVYFWKPSCHHLCCVCFYWCLLFWCCLPCNVVSRTILSPANFVNSKLFSGGSLYAPFAQFLVTSCLEDVSLDRLNRCYSINWHNKDSDLATANPCMTGFERERLRWRSLLCWCWFHKKGRWFQHIPTPDWMIFNEQMFVCGSTVWLSGSQTRRSRLRVVHGSAWTQAAQKHSQCDTNSLRSLLISNLTFSEYLQKFHYFINLILSFCV